jgi:hypothetical protein
LPCAAQPGRATVCAMKRLALVGVFLLSACDPPAVTPTRILAQCCAGVHQCYVPEAGVQVCRAGYEPIWGR